jgi:hypothetical protein
MYTPVNILDKLIWGVIVKYDFGPYKYLKFFFSLYKKFESTQEFD